MDERVPFACGCIRDPSMGDVRSTMRAFTRSNVRDLEDSALEVQMAGWKRTGRRTYGAALRAAEDRYGTAYRELAIYNRLRECDRVPMYSDSLSRQAVRQRARSECGGRRRVRRRSPRVREPGEKPNGRDDVRYEAHGPRPIEEGGLWRKTWLGPPSRGVSRGRERGIEIWDG